MSGIKFTRKESKKLVQLIEDLNLTNFHSKDLRVLKSKVERFQEDRSKVCIACGNKFISNRKTKVYCSRKCNNSSNYRKRQDLNSLDYTGEE